ncbi:hypothetical protein HHL17_12935 [Chitinophaga sp. G-6-1-13]|uniref:Uncharacterized protein n=1 Tax=Chitinophaga fulva TaxID=2728842 RepID=A0A848GMT4_9BACT|nr:hypothetical protein [Chitinophaga fulva]NML38103.1 hypothetical protein [Chitinophaga fulva]
MLSNKRTRLYAVALMLLSIGWTACSQGPLKGFSVNGREHRSDYIPIKVKKGRKKIHPSMLFNEAMRDYWITRKCFPATLQQFEYSGDKARRAVKDMRESGFTHLEIGYSLLDSMEVFFRHKPVFNPVIDDASLAVDASGKFIYTAKDSSVFNITKLDRGLFTR